MRRTGWLIPLTMLVLSHPVFSQEYSYTHYDISDGLAGSTAYCITQDPDGFIWIGTETGVSRFDGTHFKSFTTADGLPGIQILQIFGDSRGRVWMAPFRKSVCYYYKGRIYNPENDSVLRRLRFMGDVGGFTEDAKGDILVQEERVLQMIEPGGSVVRFDSLGGEPVQSCWSVSRSAAGNFLAQVGPRIFEFSGKGIVRSFPISMYDFLPSFIALNPWLGVYLAKDRHYCSVLSFSDNKRIILPRGDDTNAHVDFSLLDDSLVFINSYNHTRQINLYTLKTNTFLPGREVSRVFRDASGSLWFTTLGEGIFRLNSEKIRSVRMTTNTGEPCAAFSINRIGNGLWVGANRNLFFRYSFPNPGQPTIGTPSLISRSRLLFIDSVPPGMIVCGTDDAVYRYRKSSPPRWWDLIYIGIKSVAKIDEHRWLLGNANGAFIFDPGREKIIDTVCRERTTVVYYSTDTAYFGTLNGLYRKTTGNVPEFLGDNAPFLRRPISSMTRSADGTLWIASYDDAGIIGFRDGKIVARITQQDGLTSDICRCLWVDGKVLWIGTDKGLNKVELDRPDHPVSRFTVNDGLGSNMINAIYSTGQMVYVGTNAGLSFFDASQLKVSESCRLHLLGLINAGRDRLADTGNLVIPYKDKSIHLEYAGISYKSAGEIRYRYRLLGLDSNWRETGQTFLEYPALPSGDYRFQLQAVNKFDISSDLITLPFVVATPFWQTVWFEALVMIVFLLLLWLGFSRRIRQIRRRQDKQDRLVLEKAELENRALQAQMNPHFIFNCLNSIQQFIFDGDELAVNNYISGFARLIRATLHNSSRPFISVNDEIAYLSTYLSLEKMRFKDKMEYFIEVDPAIDQEKSLLPPMLIQPYVENCIRHGLRHKDNGKGYILVTIRPEEGRLAVVVEDNGIGRKKAMEYKSREHIEYQSKGMSMTADRIRIISAVYGGDITVMVEDVMSEDGKPAGTRILISLPEFRHWSAEPV